MSRVANVVDGPTVLDQVWGKRPEYYDVFMSDYTASMRRADPAEYFDDRGTPSEQALCLAHGHLDDARQHSAELAAHLTQAHNHLGHLGRLEPED